MKFKWKLKKPIVFAALAVVLGAAIYANYLMAGDPPDIATSGDGNKTTASTTATRPLGEALFVGADANKNYFEVARKSRESARDEAIELIEELLDSPRLTDEIRQQALAKVTAIADAVTGESAIEGLVKAKGFADCIAYVTENGCQITVKADSLTPEQRLQIIEIVLSQTSVSSQNINIVTINK